MELLEIRPKFCRAGAVVCVEGGLCVEKDLRRIFLFAFHSGEISTIAICICIASGDSLVVLIECMCAV